MIVNKRRITKVIVLMFLITSVVMIAHRISVIAVMNVRHGALVIMPSLMRRPRHARHDEGAYEQEKGCNPEHELGISAAR